MIEKLLAYGDQLEITKSLDGSKFVKWTEENFTYVRYNPRKSIERYGLSITSADGGMSGRPDLDSLLEYNKENNTNYAETDFVVPTPVFDYPDLKKLIDPWKDNIYRSHVLKLAPGGFFPVHRDSNNLNVDTFRLIVPLENCQFPNTIFLLEDRILQWKPGTLYFLNTLKMHTLFNASMSSSYWIVFNVFLNETTASSILKNLKQK